MGNGNCGPVDLGTVTVMGGGQPSPITTTSPEASMALNLQGATPDTNPAEPPYNPDTRVAKDNDDFKQFDFGFPLLGPLKGFSIDFSITRTRHGNWFLSNGVSAGLALPGFAPAITTGQTFDDAGNHVRQESQVNAVLEGHSFGARGCFLICLGGSANTTRAAYLFNIPYLSGGSTLTAGLGSPQISIGKQVTRQLPFKY